MTFEDLREYLQFLARKNDLIPFRDSVNPELELTAILSEESRIGKKRAVLFEKVQGSDIPAVGNLFASQEKMESILGEKPEDVGNRLKNIVRIPDDTESMISRGLSMFRELGGIRPKIYPHFPGDHQELEHVDLNRYPITKTWPGDAGKFITLPLVITKDPVTGRRNVGMYRMQVFDSETTGMHWQIHKGGALNYDNTKVYSKPMDVAVVIGSDPLTIFSAVAPLPDGIDEFSFRGIVSRSRFELVKGITVDLEYPRNSEIVLEGYVDPSETRIEGPFGDHTGYYSLEDQFPVFHVRKIIERRECIYTTTIVGKIWHEDVIMGKAIERMFLPLIQTQIPEIVDMNTMEESAFHNMVIVSIRKRYPGHAKKVMFALWSTGQLMFSKIVVVVDPDIDVHNRKQILWAMGTRVDPQRDVTVIPGTLTDTLDHAPSLINYGSKMGIDATRKGKEEGYARTWPEVLSLPDDILNKAGDMLKKYVPESS